MRLKFGWYFAADVSLTLRSFILVKILKLGSVPILSLSLVEILITDVGLRFSIKCLIKILKLKFDQNFVGNCEISPTLGSVVPLAFV